MGRIEGRQFYLWDTSALVKRYAVERGSARVNRILDDDDTVSHVPCLVTVEIRSVLTRKRTLGGLSETQAATAIASLKQDLSNDVMYRVGADGFSVNTAEQMAERYAIQGIDAVILAFAIQMWGQRPDQVVFVTCDFALAAAARSEGFLTYDPAMNIVQRAAAG